MTATENRNDEVEAQTTAGRRGRYLLVLIIPLLAIGWWLGSPLFIDHTVDEAFPPPPVPVPVEQSSGGSVPDANQEQDVAESRNPVEAESSSGERTASDPAAIVEGSFEGFDSVHRGIGSAAIYDLGESIVLRFEDFEVTNGPDLRVNLVLEDGDMIDIGALKGNVGDQNYTIGGDVDIDSVSGVLIYCRAFSVPFAEASLA